MKFMKPLPGNVPRGLETKRYQLRIPTELKEKAEMLAKKQGTSLNRLIEAALQGYLEHAKAKELKELK